MEKTNWFAAISTMVGYTCNLMVKAEDERKNRERAEAYGWSSDGLMVGIMNQLSETQRKNRGWRF